MGAGAGTVDMLVGTPLGTGDGAIGTVVTGVGATGLGVLVGDGGTGLGVAVAATTILVGHGAGGFSVGGVLSQAAKPIIQNKHRASSPYTPFLLLSVKVFTAPP